MKITWLGHSALKIDGSRIIFVDPFLTNNPAAAEKLEQICKADAVVVTHDHGDHLGDAFPICKKTGAILFSIFELAQEASKQGIEAEGMNVGGTITRNGMEVSFVPAFHSAHLGISAGAVIGLDGKRIYHAGDTGLTLEMQLIGEMYSPDIAFLPIDGRFNMTPRLAAKAVEILKIKRIVPIHYNTFDAIKSSPEEFRSLVGGSAEVMILQPGESLDL